MKFTKTALILMILLACNLALSAAIPAAERQALMDLYDSTNGASWTNKTDWLGAAGTENTWYGVTTDAGNTTVLGLDLPNNNMVGPLPASLADLSNLQDLLLGSNRLTGDIPPSLGNLNYLKQLVLNSSQLSGSIPPEFGNLSNLTNLSLSSNRLTGTIPSALGNLGGLWVLDLSSNQLTGNIPTSLTNLTWLATTLAITDIGYNALHTSDAGLITFLNSINPNWAATQTIVPASFSAVPGSSSVNVSWTPITYTGDTGGYRVFVATVAGGPYTFYVQTADKSTSSQLVSGLTPGIPYYFVVQTRTDAHPDNQNVVDSEYSAEVMATPAIPGISLSRSALFFGSAGGSAATGAQTVLVSNSSGGALIWTASKNKSWLGVSPVSGTGDAVLTVTVNSSGLARGTYTGAVTITAPEATNSPQAVLVTLKVYRKGASAAPFGVFDTPTSGSTVRGSIPVTGWALDDIEVTSVEVRRGSVIGDPSGAIGADGLVYVGDATFIEGARPDVETAQPGYPLNYRAGWGYMLLTYGLPDHGNGTFIIHAVASDRDGHTTDLGTKIIVADNANNTKPFGAIDTPGQGATVSGNAYVNFGWVLTPPPAMVPVDGSTIWLWINGVQVGHPTYNNYRADVHDAYPDYLNADGAVGFYYIDTTAYTDGMHTIGWSATDDHSQEEGMGSRFFWVFNGSSKAGAATGLGVTAASGLTGAQDNTAISGARNGGLKSGLLSGTSPSTCLGSLADLAEMAADVLSPIYARRGFKDGGTYELVSPDALGVRNYEIEEVERVVMALESPDGLPADGSKDRGKRVSDKSYADLSKAARWSGYHVVGSELRPLPIGSTLDPRLGVFYWQPGPGFLGGYRFVFVDGRDGKKKVVTISVRPRSFLQK